MTEQPEKPARPRVVRIPKPPKPVKGQAVALLKSLLERAERGEIVDLAVVVVTDDGMGDGDWIDLEYGNIVVGELRLLTDEISAAMRGDE